MPDSMQQDGEVSEVWVHFFTVLPACLLALGGCCRLGARFLFQFPSPTGTVSLGSEASFLLPKLSDLVGTEL